jgi:hypothetical protein
VLPHEITQAAGINHKVCIATVLLICGIIFLTYA